MCTPDSAIADAALDAAHDATLDATHDATTGAGLVQQMTASSSGAMTQALTLANRPISGDVLVMIGANNTGFLTNVAGGGVAAWMKADASAQCANTEIWYGVTNGASSTITITGFASGDNWMWVGEWSGLDNSNLLDKHASAGTNGTNKLPAPGSITTTSARELVIFSAGSQTGSFATPMPGTWTTLNTVGANVFLQGEWYTLTSSTGTFAPTVGPGTPCWDAAIASFRVL